MEKDGTLITKILDLSGNTVTLPLSATTSPDVNAFILSIHPLFSTGNYSFLWRTKERGGCAIIEFDAADNIKHIIPMEYCMDTKSTYLPFTVSPSKANGGDNTSDTELIVSLLEECEYLAKVDINGGELSRSYISDETVHKIYGEEEKCLAGVKKRMRKEKKSLSLPNFSAGHGHLNCGDKFCEICIKKKGNKKPLVKVDNHKERKRGYRWRLDTCTWDVRDLEGNKYAFVLRDAGSDVFKILHGEYRNDFEYLFIDWVEKIRADPNMAGTQHTIVSIIKTDADGVWREDVKLFQKKMDSVGVNFTYHPPEGKEGGTESNINIYEQTVKAILMERNLPGQFWGQASRDAELLLNSFPSSNRILSADGDCIRPMEFLTGGMISRAAIDRTLDAYLTLGTLCLVHDQNVKGSDVKAKTRFGVAWGMIGEVNRFRCPFRGHTFRSSSYTVIGLPRYVSYSQFLGTPDFENRNCVPKRGDYKIDASTITKLPTPRAWQNDTLKDVTLVDRIKGEEKESEFYIARKSNKNIPEEDYRLTDEQYIGRKVSKKYEGYDQPFKGIISSTDIDRETGDSIWEVDYEDGDKSRYNHLELMKILMPCNKEESLLHTCLRLESNDDYLSKSTDTFQEVCKTFDLPAAWHKIYYNWLPPELTGKFKYPFKKGEKNNLKVGQLIFPNPANDEIFIRSVNEFWSQNDMLEPFALIDNIVRQVEAEQSKRKEKREEKSVTREDLEPMAHNHFSTYNMIYAIPTPKTCPAYLKLTDEEPMAYFVEKSTQRVLHVESARGGGIAVGKLAPPEKVQEAIDRDDIELLLEAWDMEMDSLGEFGAITHDHTKSDLLKAGIKTTPIPTRMISDIKYRDGVLEKYKGRMVGQGFKMVPGVHYDGKTFSPTPNQHTHKIMMGLWAGEDLECLSFDIKLAYTWGEREGGYKIALSYPMGFRRWNSEGEALYMISHRSHYGLAPAGREWFNTRQTKLLKIFNDKKFSSAVCKSEPCLMTIIYWPSGNKPKDFNLKDWDMTVTSPDDDKLPTPAIASKDEIEAMGGKVTLMLTHVDDVDMLSDETETLERVFEMVEKEWPVKRVPSDFLLGFKREKFSEGGVTYVRMTQAACASEHVEKFKKYMPKRTPKVPIPPGTTLNKSNAGKDEKEIKMIIDMGYQKLCGACLWLARGVVPESYFAVTQVCSLMSTPSKKAFEILCGVLAYQAEKAESRGIVWRSDGNREPIVMADASFKPCPYSGKSQYGVVAVLYGGPVVVVSKKLGHVGLSTPHTETMALNQGARIVAWLRTLFAEICRPIKTKTLLLSDSTVAIHVTNEQVISEKNKFVLIAYHYVNEMKNDLEIHYLNTQEMLADILTKAAPEGVFDKLVPALTGTAKKPFSFTPKRFLPNQ